MAKAKETKRTTLSSTGAKQGMKSILAVYCTGPAEESIPVWHPMGFNQKRSSDTQTWKPTDTKLHPYHIRCHFVSCGKGCRNGGTPVRCACANLEVINQVIFCSLWQRLRRPEGKPWTVHMLSQEWNQFWLSALHWSHRQISTNLTFYGFQSKQVQRPSVLKTNRFQQY